MLMCVCDPFEVYTLTVLLHCMLVLHTHAAPFRDWYPGRQYVDMLMCNGEL
jgi:hypothetical protein